MKIPYSINPGRHRALELILTRHSPWPLALPVPSDEELSLVFAAALCAADHGRLQPWRFVLVREDSLAVLGDAYVRAAQAKDPDIDPERVRTKATAAPMVIALAARIDAGCRIPEFEQLLSAGAAAMNVLNVLHIMGYGGFWKSPPGGPLGTLRTDLGFGPDEQLVGMFYVGTPKNKSEPPQRTQPEAFVREWTGPVAASTNKSSLKPGS